MLFTLEANRSYRLALAQALLTHSLVAEAEPLIAEVNTIQADAESQKMAAVVALLQGRFPEAFHSYQLAQTPEKST